MALLRSLLFSLQQACQSQELFLSYALFFIPLFYSQGPGARCSYSQTNNPPYQIALPVAGRHSIKITKIKTTIRY